MTSAIQARVVVIAGPSGSGKSRLAERTGLPVLRLDDFYKDGDDPTLPRIPEGSANAGLVDWDHPSSWLEDDAFTAMATLCREGAVDVPIYDIAHNGRTGWQHLDLQGAAHFVADGIFAQEIVPRAREAGLLADALCLRQHPAITFWRRLTRDLREHRKPPLVLLRRGLALMRAQSGVVDHAVALGCRPLANQRALDDVAGLVAAARG
ncbi:uridine kinase [soil metagenome]